MYVCTMGLNFEYPEEADKPNNLENVGVGLLSFRATFIS